MRRTTREEQSPIFRFYANDWLASNDRVKLSLEEQGAYILLYCRCWISFEIEYDEEVLSRMCNCTIDKIRRIFEKLVEKEFLVKKERNGKTYFICTQAEQERKEQAINRVKKQKAGKLGAKIRWGK
tara:strand:- start:335 stop:712 length:378 start_codon:yes stop_codon:yes gene_type:complete